MRLLQPRGRVANHAVLLLCGVRSCSDFVVTPLLRTALNVPDSVASTRTGHLQEWLVWGGFWGSSSSSTVCVPEKREQPQGLVKLGWSRSLFWKQKLPLAASCQMSWSLLVNAEMDSIEVELLVQCCQAGLKQIPDLLSPCLVPALELEPSQEQVLLVLMSSWSRCSCSWPPGLVCAQAGKRPVPPELSQHWCGISTRAVPVPVLGTAGAPSILGAALGPSVQEKH